MKEKHIASVSFGKDSLATILLAKEHGEPLDEAVYCEVMFDKDISGEVPEHRDFIYDTAIPSLERILSPGPFGPSCALRMGMTATSGGNLLNFCPPSRR